MLSPIRRPNVGPLLPQITYNLQVQRAEAQTFFGFLRHEFERWGNRRDAANATARDFIAAKDPIGDGQVVSDLVKKEPQSGAQYSSASINVSTRVVFVGSAGSSELLSRQSS